jgi:hypothetical protein
MVEAGEDRPERGTCELCSDIQRYLQLPLIRGRYK